MAVHAAPDEVGGISAQSRRSPRTQVPPRFAVHASMKLRRFLLRAADRVLPSELAVVEHSAGFSVGYFLPPWSSSASPTSSLRARGRSEAGCRVSANSSEPYEEYAQPLQSWVATAIVGPAAASPGTALNCEYFSRSSR